MAACLLLSFWIQTFVLILKTHTLILKHDAKKHPARAAEYTSDSLFFFFLNFRTVCFYRIFVTQETAGVVRVLLQ